MTLRVPTPRLLPLTIVVMAALLAVKSVSLVRAAVPPPGAPPAAALLVAAAQAATQPQPATAAPPAAAAPVAASGDAAAKPAKPPGSAPDPIRRPAAGSPPAEPPVSDSERALLLDLRHRRDELDARDAALASREAVLAAAEKRLSDRVDELKALQGKLEALEVARKQRDEANWGGLVKLYESMKPRDAATIFNDLDMPVLLQVVDRMKDAKAAPVLAAMQPERARQVTAQLAALRSRANAVPTNAKPGG
jgi:flagellar motility protein MotE (MotC chaperone)